MSLPRHAPGAPETRLATAPFRSPSFRRVSGPTLRPGGLALTRRALEFCGLPPGARVLDLGCGPGASAAYLAEEGLTVLGLDLSAEMLAEARRAHSGLALIRARAGAVPLTDGSLDAVFMECVLSLSDDPAGVLADCRRMLRPGGRLVLSDLYLRQPPGPDGLVDLPGCLGGALGREALAELVAGAGLETLLWEDHSPLFRQLAARLAWEHGSAAALWGCADGGDCRAATERATRAKPGYFLLVASKGGLPSDTRGLAPSPSPR